MKLQMLGGAIAAALLAPALRAQAASGETNTAFVEQVTAPLAARRLVADPADSLYRSAREALSRGDYDRAAALFHDIGTRYPKSSLVPDAMYYEAFAKYRAGGNASMRSALDILASLQSRFTDSGRRSDAATLSTRICGELARQGDASCAAMIARQASRVGTASSALSGKNSAQCVGDDDDERIAALNALLQMDAERAEPILDKVLARRDECSASLRRKAVFLVAQKQSPQAADVLLHVAETDPDPGVRGQAVFWISQVPGDKAVTVLSNVLRHSSDEELRKKALFALGQTRGGQGNAILREYASDGSQPTSLRETAVFWLGQANGGSQNAQFLRELYGKATDEALRENVMRSIFESSAPDRGAWLLQIAQRSSENMETRKRALFFASQAGVPASELSKLYDTFPAGPMREQMIFTLAQSRDAAALDKLISIARTDKDVAARQKAVFWLGQSRDPRAMKALTEIINK